MGKKELTKVHHFKDGKLHIYVRTDTYKGKLKSDNFVGRTYIQSKQTIKSSGTNNFKKAKEILFKWYDKLQILDEENIQIHQSSVKDVYQNFITSIENSTKIEGQTKKWYKDRWNMLSKCKSFMNLKIGFKLNDVKETFMDWRVKREKAQKKVLRGKTIEGDLMAIQAFTTWAMEQGLRQDKITKIKQILARKLRGQKTLRAQLSKENYNHLLSVSRKRYQSGHSLRVRFERERLHQFIVFMVGTGLRVDEALSLEWEDIRSIDREKVVNRQATETTVSAYGKDFLSQLERYYLQINVGKSKTVPHTAYGTGSAYFAYHNLVKLYSSNPQFNCKVGEGTIFKLHSFREGLNSLLDEADLKFEKLGDSRVKRDSKSFRHTFIQFMLNKGMSSTAIAKMCGTSTEMIDKYYTSNMALDTMMDTFNKVKGGHLKIVS